MLSQVEILQAIQAAPEGKLDEQELLSGNSQSVALKYTNLLARMRREGLVKRVVEGDQRFYVLVEGGE